MPRHLPLLVVDGYNAIYAHKRYESLIENSETYAPMQDVASLSRDPYGQDPFISARRLLISDVATFAQHKYDAVIVFDAANNKSSVRTNERIAGVRILYSRQNESADTVIERLVSSARQANQEVLLVTSDRTIKFTVGGIPVTTISSQLLVSDMQMIAHDVEESKSLPKNTKMTLEDRLSPEQRAKLWKMLGRD